MKIERNLTNHFLVAMPTLQDSFFSKSVIYLYDHSSKGAMGIVVNKSLKIDLKDLLQHLDIEANDDHLACLPILTGGPVEPKQGFVIHDQLDVFDHIDRKNTIGISVSQEILHKICQGKGPDNFLVVLGYSGWQQGQLEQEIHRNDWLIVPLDESILFSTPLEKRWQKAAKLIGVDINLLSSQIGHA